MGSYGALWRARIRLMRPGNAAMAAVGVFVGMALASQVQTFWWIALVDAGLDHRLTTLLAAPLAAFLITGFGNTLNDIVDRDVDRNAHPDRPLPEGAIGVPEAKAWAVLLAGFGLVEAWVAGGWPLAAFAAANVALLVLYELRLKAMGLPGNVLVGLLVGSTFLFGAFAWNGTAGFPLVLPLAAMAALATIARELLKDSEDLEADRTTRRTFPSRHGGSAAWGVAVVAVSAAVGYASWHAVHLCWGLLGFVTLALASATFGTGLIQGRQTPAVGQRLLKAAMLLAMLAFLVARPGACLV